MHLFFELKHSPRDFFFFFSGTNKISRKRFCKLLATINSSMSSPSQCFSSFTIRDLLFPTPLEKTEKSHSVSVSCFYFLWGFRVALVNSKRTGSLVVQWLSMSDSVTPWTAAFQASMSFTISWSLLKLMSIELVMPSNHLILCHFLLLLPSIFPMNTMKRIPWDMFKTQIWGCRA